MTDSLFRRLRHEIVLPQGIQPEQYAEIAASEMLRVGIQHGIYTYQVADDALAHGSSLGNAKAWLTSKGTGALEQLFAVDIGLAITGGFSVNYFARSRDLSPFGWPRSRHIQPREADSLILLVPAARGEFLLHPAYQQRSYTLVGQLDVLETFFLPRTGKDDPCAVYYCTELRNASAHEISLMVNAAWDPKGDTAIDLRGEMDREMGLVVWNDSTPNYVRLLASDPPADHYLLSNDADLIVDPGQPFSNTTDSSGRLYAGVQHELHLHPGETRLLVYRLLFHHQGRDELAHIYASFPDVETVFQQTLEHYHASLGKADVWTPDTLINQGTQWCKANMVRVLAEYPIGWAFTNDPGHSSHVVARDVTWYTYGSDACLPHASCQMLRQLARLQQPSGKIIEYYDARTGEGNDYGLNINDGTPLFVLAVAHHLQVTGHQHCRSHLVDPMCRAVDYFLGQHDERGLVFCTATGTGEHGICGWRNVMAGEQISGAVTEINSECYGALLAAADAIEPEQPERATHYRQEANRLREAINTHLINPRTGMYLLNITPDGQPKTDVTADLVFPQIFGLADEETSHLISTRLNGPDMMTTAGMRTVSTMSLSYHPDRGVGLMGGVWPGVTWWFAKGSSLADPQLMIETLRRSYLQFLRNPRVYNTVPGQFCEWFDGESLINRGMRLSPWEPPRFLWTMLEGAYGITFSTDGFSLNPRIPPHWKWMALRNLPFHGQLFSWFMGNVHDQRLFLTSTPFTMGEQLEVYAEDVSRQVRSLVEHVCIFGYRRGQEVMVAVGSESTQKSPVIIEFTVDILSDESNYDLSIYTSETGTWDHLGIRRGDHLRRISTWIEEQGFCLINLCQQ